MNITAPISASLSNFTRPDSAFFFPLNQKRVDSALQATPPQDENAKKFDAFFDKLASYIWKESGEAKVQWDELFAAVKDRIRTYRQTYRLLPRYVDHITFDELAVLRVEWGLPFASRELGYSVKERVGRPSLVGFTLLSPGIALNDYCDKFFQQVALMTGSDLMKLRSEGINKATLKAYMDSRYKLGLVAPDSTKTICPRSLIDENICWSEPFDVGAKSVLTGN